jgi:hypothetical protein
MESGLNSMIQNKSTAVGLVSSAMVENCALYLFKGKQPDFNDLDLKIQASNSEGLKSFLISQSDVRIPFKLKTSKFGNQIRLSLDNASHDISTNRDRVSKFPVDLSAESYQDIIPLMNSNSQNGFNITVSSMAVSNPGFKAFQKTTEPFPSFGWLSAFVSTNYNVFSVPEWIQVEFPSAEVVNAFSIRNGSESNIVRGRLIASNNLTDWTDLKDFSPSKTGYAISPKFIFENNTAFKYYRLNIFETSENSRVGVGEFQLFKAIGKVNGIMYGINNYRIQFNVPTSTPILSLPVIVPSAYENLQTFYEKSVLSGAVRIDQYNRFSNMGLMAGELGDLRYAQSGEQYENRGTALALRTDQVVDANCIVMYIMHTHWPRATAPLRFFIHDEQDVIHEIPLADYEVNKYVKINFPRKMVKGISVYSRGVESRQTISGMRFCYFNVLTLGLDVADSSVFQNEVDYTAALLVIDEDSTTRSSIHVPPMLVMSVGNSESNAEVILDNVFGKIVNSSAVLSSKILDLPLLGS